MIAVGLILLVIAVLIAVVLVAGGGQTVAMNFVGVSLHTTATWFFVAGVVAAVLAVLGLWCLRFGTRRVVRARRERRTLRKEAEAGRRASNGGDDAGSDGDTDTYFDTAPKD